jgi:carboxylesterase type B
VHLLSEFQLSNYNDSILAASIAFQTEEVYACSSGRVANLIAQRSISVYLYSFNHVPMDAVYDIIPPAAIHTAEFASLFQNTPASYDLITGLTASERNLSTTMRRWWVNFAISGNPNPVPSTSVHWPLYEPSSDLALMIDLEQLVQPWLMEYPNCVSELR